MSNGTLLGLSIIPFLFTISDAFKITKFNREGILTLHSRSKSWAVELQLLAKLSIYLQFLLFWFRNHTWGFGLILLRLCVTSN